MPFERKIFQDYIYFNPALGHDLKTLQSEVPEDVCIFLINHSQNKLEYLLPDDAWSMMLQRKGYSPIYFHIKFHSPIVAPLYPQGLLFELT